MSNIVALDLAPALSFRLERHDVVLAVNLKL
jgi:hypothetical protein